MTCIFSRCMGQDCAAGFAPLFGRSLSLPLPGESELAAGAVSREEKTKPLRREKRL